MGKPSKRGGSRRQPGAAGRCARPQGEYACLLTGKDDGSRRLRANLPRASGTRAVLSKQSCLTRKQSRGPAQTQPPGRPTFHRCRNRGMAVVSYPQELKTPQVLGKAGAHPCNPEPSQCLASTCLPPPLLPPSCLLLLSLVHFCSTSFQAEFEMAYQ